MQKNSQILERETSHHALYDWNPPFNASSNYKDSLPQKKIDQNNLDDTANIQGLIDINKAGQRSRTPEHIAMTQRLQTQGIEEVQKVGSGLGNILEPRPYR